MEQKRPSVRMGGWLLAETQAREGICGWPFGVAVSGPREGQKLKEVVNYIGYWFAWGTFYQDLEVFGA